jgi:cation:H+ antiporter
VTDLLIWLEFVAALALVWWGGGRLALHGEALGARWGLGTTWVGLVLLATVTSLPELVTGVSAISLAGSPDIAVGAILGSCVFNLLILVIVDFVLDQESIYARLSRDHLLSAGYGIILLGIVGFNLLADAEVGAPSLGWVGIYSPLILIVYFVTIRSVHRFGRFNADRDHEDVPGSENDDRHAVLMLRFVVAAAAVVGAGIWLPFIGGHIALALDVQETFVGTIFVAFATSMPEITVAIAAVRLGAPNMAVSNLLGSNLFNMAILVPEDLLYRAGPILRDVDPTHTMSAMSAMTMTGVAMVALLVRPQKRPFARLSAVGAILISIYLLNAYVLYLYG